MSKGYDGWIAVKEGNGWGSTTVREAQFLHVDAIDMGPNKEFTERSEKIIYGRGLKPSMRTSGAEKPGGSIDFQPRSDDLPAILMAHCQMYEGTVTAGVGTYTFVNVNSQPNWSGANYGTGSYTTSAGDMFVVDVWRKFHDADAGTANIEKYTNCIVDEITMTSAANEDLKISASFKAEDYGSFNSPDSENPNSALGSYSILPQYEFFVGTLMFAGESSSAIDVTNTSIKSMNSSDDRIVLGKLNPSKYPFGRTKITGELTMDMPNDGLKHMGSMLDGRAFAYTGTWFNSLSDQISFDMPNCRRDPMSINQAGGEEENEETIPFTAYRSEDNTVAPITWTVITDGLGSAFDIV